MRIVCCCDGDGSAELVSRALRCLPATDSLVLLHCVDAGPERDVRLLHEGHWGLRHFAGGHGEAMTRAEEERAAEVLAEGAAATRAAGFTGDQETRVLHGRPEREIVRALAELVAGAVVLYPRPPSRQGPPGPHSLGHVARFVVDHAPCDVVLLRGPLDLTS